MKNRTITVRAWGGVKVGVAIKEQQALLEEGWQCCSGDITTGLALDSMRPLAVTWTCSELPHITACGSTVIPQKVSRIFF